MHLITSSSKYYFDIKTVDALITKIKENTDIRGKVRFLHNGQDVPKDAIFTDDCVVDCLPISGFPDSDFVRHLLGEKINVDYFEQSGDMLIPAKNAIHHNI